jgi:hypothetical protein
MSNKHSHYFKDVSQLDTIDVYRVIDLYKIDDPCIQHAVKKLLVAGGRGAGKDANKDIQEAIDSLERWKVMRQEENPIFNRRSTDKIPEVDFPEEIENTGKFKIGDKVKILSHRAGMSVWDKEFGVGCLGQITSVSEYCLDVKVLDGEDVGESIYLYPDEAKHV